MSLAAGSRLGPYEVQAPLGAGRMGEVYSARDTRLNRTVAIKILPSADPEMRARFEREAKAIAALQHPHICTLHDIGHQDGTDFLVLEYLDGETLARRMERGRLDTREALMLAGAIGQALAAAHLLGIVHRDLKPANVMLTKSGLKLLDFGLAKLQPQTMAIAGFSVAETAGAAPLTSQGAILGTLQYMSPEQLEGRDADTRSDVWAFGCIVYEMLTGSKPFGGSSQASLVAAILERHPPRLSELQPLTPPALDRVITKCLAKNPDARWQTVRDLLDELDWVATLQPLGVDRPAACATAVAARRGRSCRRNRRRHFGRSRRRTIHLRAGWRARDAPRYHDTAASRHRSFLRLAGVVAGRGVACVRRGGSHRRAAAMGAALGRNGCAAVGGHRGRHIAVLVA